MRLELVHRAARVGAGRWSRGENAGADLLPVEDRLPAEAWQPLLEPTDWLPISRRSPIAAWSA